jgi:hypothetical protein
MAVIAVVTFGAATASAATMQPARTAGAPTSSNGASSMHLGWTDVPTANEVSTVLEVTEGPKVQSLYFWALQVDFVDRGRTVGAAHLGLQWDPSRAGSTGVNFGGYTLNADKSSELTGQSALPSSNGDPNTRDYAWKVGRQYELRIVNDGGGWWKGEITDLSTGVTTVVRRLHVGGSSTLARPMVWSEVFARCDAPATEVRWSQMKPAPKSLLVTYQPVSAGGCTNTTAAKTAGGFVQRTNALRTVVDYGLLRVGWGS